jgi:hypothetical protein
MARPRRPGRRRNTALTLDQWNDLNIGPPAVIPPSGPAFVSRADMRQAWRDHAATLMTGHGPRPWGYWNLGDAPADLADLGDTNAHYTEPSDRVDRQARQAALDAARQAFLARSGSAESVESAGDPPPVQRRPTPGRARPSQPGQAALDREED